MFKCFTFLIVLFGILSLPPALSQEMVLVKKGSFVPLYGSADKQPVQVKSFYLDVYPVTNAQYLEFLKQNKAFTKSQIKTIFANKSYLAYWKSDLDYGDAKPNAPVTNVSWYAAKKYCERMGKRLATVDEWEYAAMSDAKTLDARAKKSYNQYILNWYESPRTYNNVVGSTFKNYWGVYDMHGLVWEWTADFNSTFLTGESRKDRGDDGNLFCGGASVNASDLMNYAAFMRYAFRGSMKAAYGGRNLGFRCARDYK
ncbi:formylglycine-generating enzyme family protein [Sphingobacterium lactis]|uniref:Formylglycine-generating enzyme, required for sulfatase activity, contains SUMF1/FGE domain n=1 Tax=Sphingobacterium lactis TaxID=797291 RepID=A0A1H6AM10_9SPHI|nr:formylglycine-generating enzyme family protein [Sphingobacterium lactis]SEG49432.1 Formylglycine-generating enzyme, required for sulfatase activity, contains SUMF1/FGE domain [Sphingobacterium lactis]